MPAEAPPRSGDKLDRRPSPLQPVGREPWPVTSPVTGPYSGGVDEADYSSSESLVAEYNETLAYPYAVSPTLSSPTRSSQDDATTKPAAAAAEASAAAAK
ncbi:hypothetical protein IWQ57_002401, partial [Coemansia nantahalensis]